MGRKEEQRGKLVPVRAVALFEKFKLVLKAQKGTKAEFCVDERWSGWMIVDIPLLLMGQNDFARSGMH